MSLAATAGILGPAERRAIAGAGTRVFLRSARVPAGTKIRGNGAAACGAPQNSAPLQRSTTASPVCLPPVVARLRRPDDRPGRFQVTRKGTR
jgi:hypothetical protein